jgi:hypothetical protein
MDIVSSYHKDSLYYDLYELARREVYTNSLVPDLMFVVLSYTDLWAIFEAYSIESVLHVVEIPVSVSPFTQGAGCLWETKLKP